jgi:hypothetical protein
LKSRRNTSWADGDAELAKLIEKELKSSREKLPPSRDTGRRRWEIKEVPLKNQLALLDGAEAEPHRLHD